MKNLKTIARVHTHTHTHTGSLINEINIKIKKDRNMMSVLKIDTG